MFIRLLFKVYKELKKYLKQVLPSSIILQNLFSHIITISNIY